MSAHVLKAGPFSLSVKRATELLLVLNLLDALFTSWWVNAGWATEANPLMASVLELGVAPFVGVKLAVGAAAALTLRAHGARRLARAGIALALCAYAYVTVVHLSQSAEQAQHGVLLTYADS